MKNGKLHQWITSVVSLTDCRVGVLSMLLWLEIDGVLCKRGGNDLLWCCNGECNAEGDWDAASAVVFAVLVVPIVVDIDVAVSTAVAPCEWFVQSYLKDTWILH